MLSGLSQSALSLSLSLSLRPAFLKTLAEKARPRGLETALSGKLDSQQNVPCEGVHMANSFHLTAVLLNLHDRRGIGGFDALTVALTAYTDTATSMRQARAT